MTSVAENTGGSSGSVKQDYEGSKTAGRLESPDEVDDKILHEDEDDVETEDKIDDAELEIGEKDENSSSKDNATETDGDFGDKNLR